MKLKVAESAGFCFGVKRALDIAYKLSESGKASTLGPIIHNDDVVRDLERHGIKAVENISDADGTLIIRSHGVAQSIYDELSEKNIPFVDATCPFVTKIHKIVAEESEKGADVLIAGDKTHPEVIGIVGHCKTRCRVVSSAREIEDLVKNDKTFGQKSLIFVAQTTFDLSKWTEYQKNVKNHYTNVKFFDTICSATMYRQSEAKALAKESDVMIVIGGRNSSNSAKLAHICEAYCRTWFVENSATLPKAEIAAALSEHKDVSIGITAGASTPDGIIKEVHSIMSEIITNDDTDIDFMAEVDKTFKRVYIGNRVKAYVVSVNNTEAVVDIGTKHSGYIPADELSASPNVSPKDIVKVGDEIDCIVTSINDMEGVVYLSKKRIDTAAGLEKLITAANDGVTLKGFVTAVVKGGIIVMCEGARVFVPASHSGVPRGRRTEVQESPEELQKKLEVLLRREVFLKIIEVNEARGRVVGSIKNASKEVSDAAKSKFWDTIEIGKKFIGEVKSMESYGVFVDLGGVDGMVHTSELTWNRIKHPKDLVSIGQKLEVYVKSFDIEKHRVSLSAKDPKDNPWAKFLSEYKVGDVVDATVVSITPFGAFAQIVPSVDGLIHISQISLSRVTNVAQVLATGQVVKAKITEIDEEKSRVSLSIKALLEEEAIANGEELPVEETADAE